MTTPAEEAAAVPELMILDLTETPEPESSAGSGGAGSEPNGRHHKRSDEKPPPTGAPTASEWQDFIGGTVLRLLTEGYLNLVLFRSIDESELSDRERELIRLSKDELRDMASPMASFAYKNKHAKRHGREIIAAADSYEALIDLFIWMRRVNRIAAKHRVPKPGKDTTIQGEVIPDGPLPGQNIGQPGTVNGIVNRGTG